MKTFEMRILRKYYCYVREKQVNTTKKGTLSNRLVTKPNERIEFEILVNLKVGN